MEPQSRGGVLPTERHKKGLKDKGGGFEEGKKGKVELVRFIL